MSSDGTMLSQEVRPAVSPRLSVHVDSIDGLRGLAALTIVVFHLFQHFGCPELRPFWHLNVFRPLHDGWCGVNLFLVISGFCLFWPYALDSQRPLVLRSFFMRRILRIVPAYYASLMIVPVCFTLLHFAGLSDSSAWPRHGLTDIILHLTLLHSLLGDTIHSWNGVTWTLGLEWLWYLMFPLMVWAFRHFGAPRALALVAVATIGYRLLLYMLLGPSAELPLARQEDAFALRVFVLGRLLEFGMGMFVAWWLATRSVPDGAIGGIIFCGLVLLAVAHVCTPVDVFLPVRDNLYGVAFALFLLVTAAPSQHGLRRLFDNRFLRGVGEYSYSLYLFHMPLVALVCGVIRVAGATGPAAFLLSLLSVPVILFCCRLAFLAFEAPYLRAKHRGNCGSASVRSVRQETMSAKP